jgi:hypothetical protein
MRVLNPPLLSRARGCCSRTSVAAQLSHKLDTPIYLALRSLFVYRTSVARGFDFAQFVKTTMQEVCQMLPLPVLPQTGFSSKSNPSTTFALDFNKPLYSTIKSNLPLRSARHSAS